MVKPSLRTKSIGTKVTEEEFANSNAPRTLVARLWVNGADR